MQVFFPSLPLETRRIVSYSSDLPVCMGAVVVKWWLVTMVMGLIRKVILALGTLCSGLVR